MTDDGNGPEFWCADLPIDELTLPELERRAELRRQEEIAAIVARWEAMDDAPPVAPADPEPLRYRTPQATIDAFKYVAELDDLSRLQEWLAARPKDTPFLLALLKRQLSCA